MLPPQETIGRPGGFQRVSPAHEMIGFQRNSVEKFILFYYFFFQTRNSPATPEWVEGPSLGKPKQYKVSVKGV